MSAALLLLILQTLNAQPDRFGLPACSAPAETLAHRTAFVLCFSSSTKTATWTAYELKPETLNAPATARPSHFRPDPELNSASNTDFRNSSYDRGHLVPAADMSFNPEAQRDSFLISNAVPQNPSLNRGKWASLEKQVRKLAAGSDSVIVLTGPVFCEEVITIGANHVAVPCSLFKVVLIIHGEQTRILALILPNAHNPSEPLEAFTTTLNEVETRTGLHFFPTLNPTPQTPLS